MKIRRGPFALGAVATSILATLAALAALLPATSSAATAYPQNEASRSFEGVGTGDWAANNSYGGVLGGLGLCGVLGVICPTLENTKQPAGGNPGGYLNTNGSGTLALLATAGSTWTSPQFQYDGDAGKKPDILQFSMDGRADIGGLLAALPGSVNTVLQNVTQKVEIVDANDNANVIEVVVPEAPLTQILGLSLEEVTDLIGGSSEATWQTAAANVLAPTALTQGNLYQIRVTTEYSGLAGLGIGLLPDFNVGLDNVSLTAVTGSPSGGPGGPGEPGQQGGPGSKGDDGSKGRDGNGGRDGANGAVLNGKTLLKAVNKQFARNARVARNGKWIRIRETCPKQFNRRCVIRTVARFNRRGPVITRANRRVVGKGVRRTKALLVKPGYRAKAKNAKRVFIQATVKVGKVKVRVNRPVRLVKR